MKVKDQILKEEKKLLELLIQSKSLELESDLVINSVCVSYLVTNHEHNKKFAIIKTNDKYNKEMLELAGYRTLQSEESNINQIEFLIDYIFRN